MIWKVLGTILILFLATIWGVLMITMGVNAGMRSYFDEKLEKGRKKNDERTEIAD